MSETELSKVVEINTEEQRRFLDAIQIMPQSGIAFRGDPITRAKGLRNGLNNLKLTT